VRNIRLLSRSKTVYAGTIAKKNVAWELAGYREDAGLEAGSTQDTTLMFRCSLS